MPALLSARGAAGLGRRDLFVGLGAMAAAVTSSRVEAALVDGPAEQILLGRIATFDAADRIVEAIAIRDGIITAAGSRDEVLTRRGAGTSPTIPSSRSGR